MENLAEEVSWSRSLASPDVNRVYVSVGPRSVLVAAVFHEVQEGYQRSAFARISSTSSERTLGPPPCRNGTSRQWGWTTPRTARRCG